MFFVTYYPFSILMKMLIYVFLRTPYITFYFCGVLKTSLLVYTIFIHLKVFLFRWTWLIPEEGFKRNSSWCSAYIAYEEAWSVSQLCTSRLGIFLREFLNECNWFWDMLQTSIIRYGAALIIIKRRVILVSIC